MIKCLITVTITSKCIVSITHINNNHIIKVIIKCKEVIQPQVPLRLPCYDFTLLKKPRFEYNKTLHPHPSPFWVV